jgi:glycosyltransferase involved in cell wall biosynthesis
MREDWVCMMRCRNEERWIARSLERTFEVCKTVVLFDDGSTDAMWQHAVEAVGPSTSLALPGAMIYHSEDDARLLHYLPSPFSLAVREKERVNEIRDKNVLWYYIKARTEFKHVLCLDGDEMLSREAIRKWSKIEQALEADSDILTVPFVYLWDSEQQARVDGIYGNLPDGAQRLRFPRIFTIKRVTPQSLFDMHFSWHGTKGGFHCGSIPQTRFETELGAFRGGFINAPVVHMGYIDDPLRQRKFVFYRSIDPGNKAEGEYLHIIGEPDVHAPGPVQLVPWEDA